MRTEKKGTEREERSLVSQAVKFVASGDSRKTTSPADDGSLNSVRAFSNHADSTTKLFRREQFTVARPKRVSGIADARVAPASFCFAEPDESRNALFTGRRSRGASI